jgi:Ala-tRNA(Pro) deacylase
MRTLDRVLALLEMKGCWYQHDQHPLAYTAREVATVDKVPERAFAKTVVVQSEHGFAFAVLPADRRVDLEELRVDFGFDRLRLATEHELQELFPECELGAMPPFGNGSLFDLPVEVDGLLMAEDTIAFNAGTHRDVVRMNTDDWTSIVKPTVVAFARSARVGH